MTDLFSEHFLRLVHYGSVGAARCAIPILVARNKCLRDVVVEWRGMVQVEVEGPVGIFPDALAGHVHIPRQLVEFTT